MNPCLVGGGDGRRWGSDRPRGRDPCGVRPLRDAQGLLQGEASGQDLSTTCKSSCTPTEWQEEWSMTVVLGSGSGLSMSCQGSKIKGQRDKGNALGHPDRWLTLRQQIL